MARIGTTLPARTVLSRGAIITDAAWAPGPWYTTGTDCGGLPDAAPMVSRWVPLKSSTDPAYSSRVTSKSSCGPCSITVADSCNWLVVELNVPVVRATVSVAGRTTIRRALVSTSGAKRALASKTGRTCSAAGVSRPGPMGLSVQVTRTSAAVAARPARSARRMRPAARGVCQV